MGGKAMRLLRACFTVLRLLVVVPLLRSGPLLAQEPLRLAPQPIAVTLEFEAEGLPSAIEVKMPAARMTVGGDVTKILCLAYSPDGRTLAVGDGPTHPLCNFL